MTASRRLTTWLQRWPRSTHWTAVAVYAGLIFFLSAQPAPEDFVPPLLQDVNDKVFHGIEYGILAVLCYRAFYYAAGAWAARHALWLALLFTIGYAFTDELHQAFVPSREADAMDLMADSLGAIVAAVGWHWAGLDGVRE